MPSKSKKRDKKKGKKEKEKPVEIRTEDETAIPPEETEQFYKDRVTQLTHTINRYKKRLHDLEQDNINIRIEEQGIKNDRLLLASTLNDSDYQTADIEFKPKYQKMKEDRELDELKYKLKMQDNEMKSLVEQISAVEQQTYQQKAHYDGELATLRREYQETKDTLTSRTIALNSKQREIEKFVSEKPVILQKIQDMEDEMAEKQTTHNETIDAMNASQNRHIQRLKKDLVHHLNDVSTQFRKDSQDYMQDTTKTTIRENVIITDQMGKMADRMNDIEQENLIFRTKCLEQMKRIKELEEKEKILAKEAYSSGRIVQMLSEKSKAQKKELNDKFTREDNIQDLEDMNTAFKAEVDSGRNHLEDLSARKHQLQDEGDQAITTLEGLEDDIIRMEDAVDKVTLAIPKLSAYITQGDVEDDTWLTDKDRNLLESMLHTVTNALDPDNSPDALIQGEPTLLPGRTIPVKDPLPPLIREVHKKRVETESLKASVQLSQSQDTSTQTQQTGGVGAKKRKTPKKLRLSPIAHSIPDTHAFSYQTDVTTMMEQI